MPNTNTNTNANANARNIAEIQTYLRVISFTDDTIPEIAVDGIYGPETTDAVKRFQEREGLPVTGKVDLDTWNALVSAYLAARNLSADPHPLFPFPTYNFLLRENDANDLAIFVQVIINALSETFSNIPAVKMTGIYNTDTINSVKIFQAISLLSPTGLVNKETWDALAKAYNIYRKQTA